jgi:CubicO group peptidase (beta-lactamase class C family)
LLNHTSGLAGDFLTDTGSGSDRLARYLDRCALLPQVHAPGGGFSYCNSGYCVAGRLIEVVTGVDFDTALKTRLLDALELCNSVSRPSDAVGRSVSAGHTLDPSTARNVRSPTLYTLPISGAPAGATLLMSVSDLIDFARMHLLDGVAVGGRPVLSEASARAMQQSSVDLPVPARDIARWGLGWFIVEPRGGQFIGHDGATVGQSAYLRIHRESATIAALFVNGGAPNDAMLEVFARTLDPLVGVTASPPPSAIESPTADLSRFAGRYSTIATDVEITVEDGRLVRTGMFGFDDVLIAEPPVALQPSGINQFMFVRPPAQFPTTVSYLEFDRQGRGSTIFSGLRLFRRVP